MLILSRKEQENIQIADNIEIKIIQISKNGVKIGIEAPKNILILRGELVKEIKQSNFKASLIDEKSLVELSKKIKK